MFLSAWEWEEQVCCIYKEIKFLLLSISSIGTEVSLHPNQYNTGTDITSFLWYGLWKFGVVENILYWKSEDAGPNLKTFDKSVPLDPSIFM